MSNEILVIGDYESVIIYKIFGCDTIFYDNNFTITTLLNLISKKSYKTIFLIDDVYAKLKDQPGFDKINVPLVPLSGIKNKNFYAKEKYSNLSKIATGIKLDEGDRQ
jgi:vacuolar-type H+-ATPase subunit F/Vma7